MVRKRKTFAEVEKSARIRQREEDIAEFCRVLKHKRKTFEEVAKSARIRQREEDIAEFCRVLKHHFRQPDLADEVYEALRSGKQLAQSGFIFTSISLIDKD